MTLRFHTALLAVAIFSSPATAAECKIPLFETFVPAAHRQPDSNLVAVEIGMDPVARLHIPNGFSEWGALPHGSVVFGGHPKGISGGLTYETKDTVSPHQQDVTPADFVLSIFKGLNAIGCQYAEGQRLQEQDYRLYARLSNDAELFAFGTGKKHHFYIVRKDKPDYVLNGLFKNISREEFEIILSTIQTP